MRLADSISVEARTEAPIHRAIGHHHFWDRALTRRDVLTGGLGAAGLLATSGVWSPVLGHKAFSDPKPIPGVIFPGTPFHIEFPVLGNEVSAISDFNGFVGAAEIQGAGDAWEAGAQTSHRLVFDVDMRFMTGEFIGVDGRQQHGTFAFT